MLSERLSPMVALRRHRTLTVLFVLCGFVAGVGLGLLRPTIYTAEARLAVGGNAGLAAEAVPGYALASQELAANYARYVDNAQDQSALEAHLGIRRGVVQQVSASPIPESNIVRVEVTARVPSTAKSAADAIATRLMEQVNDTTRTTSAGQATLARYTQISSQVAAAQQAADSAKASLARVGGQTGADLVQLTKTANDTATQLAILQVQQEALADRYRNEVASLSGGAADLVVVEAGAVTGDSRVAQLEQFGLGGLVAGFLVGLLLSVLLDRRAASRSAPGAEESAGSPVDTPGEPVPALLQQEPVVVSGDRAR